MNFGLLNEQVVSGIAMPSGSDKLYTGSTDETVRVWDCQSGQVVTISFYWQFLLTSVFLSICFLFQIQQ